MSMVKVTFTLDDRTVTTLRQTAARLDKPNSQIVREAIRDSQGMSDLPALIPRVACALVD